MAETKIYIIDSTDGTTTFAIQPRVFDGSSGVQRNTDLTLYGNATKNWGERFNENFYRLLENFACHDKGAVFHSNGTFDTANSTITNVPQNESDIRPGLGINRPITGQLWYSKTNGKLYSYSGTEWTSVQQELSDVYVKIIGDTMTGSLVIDMETTSNPNLKLISNSNPYMVLEARDACTESPAIVFIRQEPSACNGVLYTKIANREGSVFSVEMDIDDVGGAQSYSVLTISQSGEMTYHGVDPITTSEPYNGDIAIPNATVLEPYHATTKQYVDAVTAAANGFRGFKNQIINGTMDFWQRGTSFTSNTYTADRWWKALSPVGEIVTRSTDAPSDQGFQYSLLVTAPSTSTFAIRQPIEDFKQFRNGSTWTISFWVKGSIAATGGGRFIWAFTNDPNSDSALMTSVSASYNITTSWNRISIPFVISQAPPAGTTQLLAMIGAANYQGGLNITGVQLEPGSGSSSYEFRPTALELSMCQRYYETGSTYQSLFGTLTIPPAVPTNELMHWFRTTKRVAPTISAGTFVSGGSSNVSQNEFIFSFVYGWTSRWNPVTPNTDAAPYVFDWKADAEFY